MQVQGRRRKRKPVAEMNVVPYIDVMLVLLVIFMVTAPMLNQGVKVDLPQVASEVMPPDTNQQVLTLSVLADGTYFWNLGETVDTENQTDSAVTLEQMSEAIWRQKPILLLHGSADHSGQIKKPMPQMNISPKRRGQAWRRCGNQPSPSWHQRSRSALPVQRVHIQ